MPDELEDGYLQLAAHIKFHGEVNQWVGALDHLATVAI